MLHGITEHILLWKPRSLSGCHWIQGSISAHMTTSGLNAFDHRHSGEWHSRDNHICTAGHNKRLSQARRLAVFSCRGFSSHYCAGDAEYECCGQWPDLHFVVKKDYRRRFERYGSLNRTSVVEQLLRSDSGAPQYSNITRMRFSSLRLISPWC